MAALLRHRTTPLLKWAGAQTGVLITDGYHGRRGDITNLIPETQVRIALRSS
jgi:hypothetical protein